ncbi:MAG TPA: hypothetical protein VK886_08595 [Vicinamibacterales bacterium]|nr:hypothetical protein [Vicinamibacterales bacterium]
MKRATELFIVFLGALAATAVMTYPLILELGSGGRIQLNDGRWSIWVVSWVARALTSSPAGVLDANIFHPNARTLLLSEPNLGAGLLAAPAWALTHNPLFAHNAVALASFILAALATYYLARHLTGDRPASAVAAVLFAFCPYVFAHTAHIQLLMTAGLPLTLLALHRFVEQPGLARGAAMGAAVAAQALSCGYYGVLAAFIAVGGVLFFAAALGRWRVRSYWAGAVAGALLALALVLPFFVSYIELQRTTGFSRSLAGSVEHSAMWQNYLVSAAWAHRWLVPVLGGFTDVLFPGVIAVVLGACGAYAGLRSTARRAIAIFYVLLAILGAWLSFGPPGGLYTLLYRIVPALSFIRAPTRMGVSVILALAVLSALAVAALTTRQTAARRLLVWLLPVFAAAELFMAPLPLLRMPPVPAAYRMLATLPRGPVAEFPYYASTRDIQFHALYMLWSTYHWQPMINGYSDILPQDFGYVSSALATFPSGQSFEMLQKLEARYLIVNYPRYGPEDRASIGQTMHSLSLELRLLAREYDVALYEIVAWPEIGGAFVQTAGGAD